MTRRRYPQAQMSQRKAVAAVASLLSGCTAERLAAMSAASLAGSYNVPLDKAEEMLAAARKVRAA